MQNFHLNTCRKSGAFLSISLALLLAGNCAGVSAQSATANPSWYIGPSVLGIDPEPDFGVDRHGPGAELRFGKPFAPSWDVQFGASYARVRRNNDRYQQNLLGADLLYFFSRDAMRPFLLLGAGAQRDKLNKRDAQNQLVLAASDTSHYVNAGIGLQIALSEQWTLQADVRRVRGFPEKSAFNFDRSDTNYLAIGFNYAFDKPIVRARSTASPAPAPASVAVAPPAAAPRFEKVKLSSTELFEFDRAELIGPKPKLDEIAMAVNKDLALKRITIIGHADRIGSEQYNRKLSERRALAVKNYLVGKGVSASRIVVEARGESEPVVYCDDKKRDDLIKCLAPNRRAVLEEITIERRIE